MDLRKLEEHFNELGGHAIKHLLLCHPDYDLIIETCKSVAGDDFQQSQETRPHETIVMWRDADMPPDGNKDKWSRKVIAVTNYGNVYSLCYYHGINGGNWQRRVVFEDGEKVLKWTDFPDT